MERIVQKFRDSLALDASEIAQDYVELGIDSIVDNEVIKNIPIVKSLVSAGKIINSIYERNLAKNLLIFLNELNSGNIDKEKLNKHINVLKNPKQSEKELGRFLIILNQTIDNEKAVLYGKIYKAFINQKIAWDEVIEYTEIVSRLFIQDLEVLKDLFDNKTIIVKDRSSIFKIDRLYALGIVGFKPKELYPGGGIESYAVLNELGKIFAQTIFE